MFQVKLNKKERAILVGVTRNRELRWETEDHLEELALLTDTAGAEVVEKFMQERKRIDPAYFVGQGKAGEISDYARAHDIDLIVFDDDLSPAQIRNFERLSNKKIMDRSGVILDIFARRAKTSEAKTQVELAQLNYLLPRLTRQWTHLSRQVGGIGTRGPGETQLEVDRRLIRKRISALSKELQRIQSQRKVRRKRREKIYRAALVGYTNSGKSTLMNLLTDSKVFVENRLFATLDSTVRKCRVAANIEVLLSDTVGFIRKLPHDLVASFLSTLEEVTEADLLLHVIDISHPNMEEHISVVNDVLKQLSASDKMMLLVFNKIDKLANSAIIERLRHEHGHAVFISASRGLFLDDLRSTMKEMYLADSEDLSIKISSENSQVISRLYELGDVYDASHDNGEVLIKLKASVQNKVKIQTLLQKVNGCIERNAQS